MRDLKILLYLLLHYLHVLDGNKYKLQTLCSISTPSLRSTHLVFKAVLIRLPA